VDFGLNEMDIAYIVKTIKKYPEVKRAVIFGSRAKGTYKPGSDIDIAIYGENLNFNIVASLHSALEDDSPMPYFFDIVDYTHTTHEELKEHIDRVGKEIYE
jgi:predicted nucleotidyltransferase